MMVRTVRVLAATALLISCLAAPRSMAVGVINSILPLDIAVVTTAGTAVNALAANHAQSGGWVATANVAGICVNVRGVATTTSSGDTFCVAQNVIYQLPNTKNAISVNSTASGVAIAGNGRL